MGAQLDGAPNPPGSSYPGEAQAPPPSDGACELVSTGEWIWPSWGLSYYSQEEKGITWPLVWVTATYEDPHRSTDVRQNRTAAKHRVHRPGILARMFCSRVPSPLSSFVPLTTEIRADHR